MLPTMEQADEWVRRAPVRESDVAQVALWLLTDALTVSMKPYGVGLALWLRPACALLKSKGQHIILTDYPAQDVPWHVLGMQLTAAACVGEVASACGELLKWCHANNVPLCEAMEGL